MLDKLEANNLQPLTHDATARTNLPPSGNVVPNVRRTLLALLLLPALARAQTKGVVVQVRQGGKPVAVANVTVDDGKTKREALVEASTNGEAIFSEVRPGSLKVTVRYRAGGKEASVTQLFDEKNAGERVTVALPEAEPLSPPGEGGRGEGVAISAPPPAQTAAPAKRPEPTGGFNLVGTLFALLVGGAAAAGIWFYIKGNPEKVGGTLERLGAQIPKPGDAPLADPPVAAAPAPLAPEPPQKIVLDPVAPISLNAPVTLAAPTGEPALVSDAGVPIPLIEGETVVGREVGLGLSLAGESTVSRRHARIVRSGGLATLYDEGSTNGTFVNGQRLAGSQTLSPGDAVQFGSVRFRYEG